MSNAIVPLGGGAALALLVVWALLAHVDYWRIGLSALLVAFSLAGSSIESIAGAAYYARLVCVALLLVSAFKLRPHRQIRSVGARLLLTLWLCGAVGAASTVWSISPVETASYSVLFLLLLLNLHAAMSRRWTSQVVIVGDLRVAFFTLTAVVTVGVVAAIAGADYAVGFGDRARGLFDNANMLGAVAAVTAPLGWTLAGHYRANWYFVASAPAVLAVIMSGSRTGMIALTVAGLWSLLRAPLAVKVLTTWTAATVSAFFAFLYSTGLLPAFSLEDGPFARFFVTDEQTALNGRLPVWQFAVGTGADTGVGVGFGASPTFMASDLQAQLTGLVLIHNSYLQWFIETGFAGLAPMVALLIVTVGLLVTGRGNPLAADLGAVVVAGLVLQVTESMMFGVGQVHPWAYWLVVAAMAALKDIARRDKTKSLMPTNANGNYRSLTSHMVVGQTGSRFRSTDTAAADRKFHN